jgi:tetratricopeptide (TPR) repeat protein
MERDVQALLDAGNEADAQALARRTLLPAAQLLEQHAASQPPSQQSSNALTTVIARAYLFSGEFNNALPRFDDLLRRSPDRADLLLGRAESLYGLGGEAQFAEAMPNYKRLAAAGPDSSAGADVFWLSQLRMLQIVDRVNRHTEDILPRIERLRQQDPTFGGERFRRGFDALRMKYSRS